MPSSGKIELDTHLLEAKLAEFLAVYYIHWHSRLAGLTAARLIRSG